MCSAIYFQCTLRKIVLVTDNLNTHSPASLYKAFPPEEARRLMEHFEWHYTPKHSSWLDMAEIEIGLLCRQALAKPMPDFNTFQQQVHTWTVRRNSLVTKINCSLLPTMPGLNLQDFIPLFFEFYPDNALVLLGIINSKMYETRNLY